MENTHMLYARQNNCYVDRYGRTRCSRWSSWGRWVMLAVIVGAFFLLAFACCCVSRRRRKRGVKPFYGTGWMAPQGKFGHHQNQQSAYYNQGGYNQGGYNQGHQMNNYGANNYQQPYASPPAYGGQQQDYYGGQQYGVQQPQAAYQGNSYAPPPGPPPGK